jgi:hypothetical protein
MAAKFIAQSDNAKEDKNFKTSPIKKIIDALRIIK